MENCTMKKQKPLLSICIPTYNRAEFLDKNLASIVSQLGFDSENVEVVISDNASTDNTEAIVKKYKEQHKNIYYSKNEENIGDRNFPIVIGNAHGVFRKLCNDRIIFTDNSIQYMLEIINEHSGNKPVLFFLNTLMGKDNNKYIVDNFNSFMEIISFGATWIGAFGIWEDDFELLKDKFEACSLHLWQTKVLLETVARKKKSIIDNNYLFIGQDVPNVMVFYLTNSNDFDIFYTNYLGLCRQYLASGILSKTVFEGLRKDLLFRFFLDRIIFYRLYSKKNKKSIENQNEKLILNEYCQEVYYTDFCLKLKKRFQKRLNEESRKRKKRIYKAFLKKIRQIMPAKIWILCRNIFCHYINAKRNTK